MKKEKWYQKALDWVQSKGMHSIRSKYGSFDDPKSFILKGEDDTFTPDITAFQRSRKRYFEIANKNTEDRKRMISKWKLLSTLAFRKGGKFYLMAPYGHKAFAERIIKKHNLHSEVISI